MIVLGIDPGARFTGLAVVKGTPSPLGSRDALLLAHDVISHDTIDEAFELVGDAICTLVHDNFERRAVHTDDPMVDLAAIEDVVAPNPHKRRRDGNSIINLDGLLDTAKVYGYAWGSAEEYAVSVVAVRPAGNGSSHLGTYPDELVTAGERRGNDWRFRIAGKSNPINHARSAWDVALQGLTR